MTTWDVFDAEIERIDKQYGGEVAFLCSIGMELDEALQRVRLDALYADVLPLRFYPIPKINIDGKWETGFIVKPYPPAQ